MSNWVGFSSTAYNNGDNTIVTVVSLYPNDSHITAITIDSNGNTIKNLDAANAGKCTVTLYYG